MSLLFDILLLLPGNTRVGKGVAMTKEKHIYYLETALAEEIVNCEDEEKLRFKQQLFDAIGSYISVLKNVSTSYKIIKSASMAFGAMLLNRIQIAMEENDSLFDDNASDKESVNSNLDIVKRCFQLLGAHISVVKIFGNCEELRELADEIMCQAKEKNELSKKQALEEVNTCSEEVLDYNSDEWLESFGCTIQNIKDLEALIGPQADFDEVMGRIIKVKYY